MNGDRCQRCNCARCRTRCLMGPVILITLGVLFMLSEFHVARFHYTWPVILIVIGLIKVLTASASLEGHRATIYVPPSGPSAPPPGAQPPTNQSQVGNV